MNIKTQRIYSEVYQVLLVLGNDYINKLPNKLLTTIEEKRDITYNPIIKDDIALSEQNVKKETLSVIALMHLNYWCESEEEKEDIKNTLQRNEANYQDELKNKYDPKNIFENSKPIEIDAIDNEKKQTELIEYKETIFRKIISKIKSIFKLK